MEVVIIKKGYIVAIILLIAVIAAAFITNPSKDHFTSWLADKIKQQATSENPSEFESKITDYLTEYLGKNLLSVATTHYDYKIFSVYKVKVLEEEMTFIGLFNTFIKTK